MASNNVPLPCNPSHLRAEERLVEYEVRGINAQQDYALARLYEAMQLEDIGQTARPLTPHRIISDEAEVASCGRIVTFLRQEIPALLNDPNWSAVDVVRSRVAHVTHRVDRLVRSRPVRAELELLKVDVLALLSENILLGNRAAEVLGQRHSHFQ